MQFEVTTNFIWKYNLNANDGDLDADYGDLKAGDGDKKYILSCSYTLYLPESELLQSDLPMLQRYLARRRQSLLSTVQTL